MNANQNRAGVSAVDAFRREVDAAQAGLSKAYKAGVTLISGTETGWSPVPYGQWHAYEMQIFVDLLGMTPLQAIHSATGAATRCLKRFGGQVGRLEAGRFADIIVVDGNPLADISLLQKKTRFDYVFKGGEAVDLTPAKPVPRWHFEKHKIFLNGNFNYDEELGSGVLVH
jgi:imidazolonepropionase-like amidohydrolase